MGRTYSRSFAAWLLLAAVSLPVWSSQSHLLTSPDNRIQVSLEIDEGRPCYQVAFSGRPVILSSALGFEFVEQPPLREGFVIAAVDTQSVDETWLQPWGEQRQIRNHYNELRVTLRESEAPGRSLVVVFRAFDDGVGFRYEFPDQPGMEAFRIKEELTEFALAENFQAWWIPAYRDQRYEYQYAHSAVSSVDVVHTPLTLEGDDLVVVIHEAALVDYAAMTLRNIADNHKTLRADLVPWADGVRVYGRAPMRTPWRTIQIAERPIDLYASYLMLNLNEPNRLGDVSWVDTGKYMGIWWEMHIGLKDWSPGPRQGATSHRAREYIDFAAQHDIDAVLIEGWNKGWEGEWWQRKPTFDFTTPVAGLDLEAVVAYGRERGVDIIGHHETAAGISHYEQQMDAGFAYYEKLGIHNVKTGYVGTRAEGREWHHGQFMVRHFQKVTETAARHHIGINAHETIKDTGLRRTWPNMLTREAARGMEYNGGSPDTGNLPNHTAIIPFTRMQAGPFDFNTGIFNFDYRATRPHNRVPTTLAKQLALYVVIFSPLQMAPDLPENYAGHPAFKFIDDVPVIWDRTVGLNGEIGQYITLARKDWDSDDWYLGAITNERPRKLTVALDFLDSDREYLAETYADGTDAHWRTRPESYVISSTVVTSEDSLAIAMAPGGGMAVRFSPRE
jgi:alpha-glucosidase